MSFWNSKEVNPVLLDYGRLYLNLVIGRYRALNSVTLKPGLDDAGVVKQFVNKEIAQLTWGDLLLIEMTIVNEFSPEDLRREAPLIRRKYREVAGLSAYEDYLKSDPPNPLSSPFEVELLRSDLKSIIGQINWLYASAPGLKKKRTDIIKKAALIPGIMLLVIGIWVLVGINFELGPVWELPALLLVAFAGAFGGLISMLQRLQRTPVNDDPIDDFTDLSNGRFSFFIGPVIGAFLALILYFIFAAEMIKGSLFPTIETLPKQSNHILFGEFTGKTGVTSGIDYAKLLVWSFLAGFAERFVPDTLNLLVDKKGTADSSKKTA